MAGTTWIFRADGVPAATAALGNIAGVITDGSGNIYAADSQNHVVVKVSPAGVLTVVAGNGISGFSGEGGLGVNASLSAPSGVAVDPAGNIYIADKLNHRIRRVSGGVINTIAGSGSAGFSGDNGPANIAQLNSPSAVAVDLIGNLYVADTLNNVIRKISPGGIISTVVGTGIRSFSGDGAAANLATLSSPQGMAVDSSGNLFIADRDNQRIRKVSTGGTITTLAGTGTSGFSGEGGMAIAAQLSFPTGVALDASGNLYVADSVNQRVRRINSAGTISTVAGGVNVGFAGDGGPATSATLSTPQSVAVDGLGNLYIADTFNNRIRRVTSSGTIATVGGNGMYKFGGDGGPASSAVLNSPQAVVVDAGFVYVIDQKNHRVRRINSAGVVTTVAGTGTPGFSGDGGLAGSAALNSPSSVAIDAVGNLYIADTGNSRIRKVSPTQIISTLAGTGATGYSGDGGPAVVAALNQPAGVAADIAGNVYVSDTGNHRLRRVNASGIITTLAGNGVAAFGGDGGPALSAMVSSPAGLTVDVSGSLFVADKGNHRVRRITGGGTITTVAGTGQPGSSGDGSSSNTAQLNSPAAVAVDGGGNFFIAESAGHRIRKVSAGVITTVAGTGVAAFSGDGGPATSAALNQPHGVAVDTAGNIYIADTLNDRIREVLASTPSFLVSPASLTFTIAAGTPVVGAQLLGVNSSVSGLAFSATVSTTSGGNWLVISPGTSSGTVPGSISIAVSVSGLTAGTYQGAVTVTAPGANPRSQTIEVTLIVVGTVAPRLLVEPSSMVFDIPAGVAAIARRALRIANAGSGILNWNAVAAGGTWLSVSPSSGSASATAPGTLQVDVDPAQLEPGVYSAVVEVTSPDTSQRQTVAVTVLMAQVPQSIFLSQAGLLFTGVEGGGLIPSQNFGVLNTGQGTMNWSANSSTLSGGSWLNASPLSGSSQADSVVIPTVDVQANVGSLTKGRYSGLVQVQAVTANNSPQFISVDMSVLPSGANPGVVVRPTGLIFAARQGTSSPGSQTILLSRAGPLSVEARAGVLTFDGAGWLDVRPRNVSLSPGSSQTLTIQPSLGALSPGQYSGTITLLFSDGSPAQVVSVLFVVVGSSSSEPQGQDGAADGSCVPSKLLTLFRTLSNGFSSMVGLPKTLEAQVADDCGNMIPNATVIASFSNADPPVTLTGIGNGIYTGTWRPSSAAPQVTAIMRAIFPPLQAGEVRVQGEVTEDKTSPVPFFFSGGVVNAASFTPDSALAPGTIVALFGKNLASRTESASTASLPLRLGGAALRIGGINVPLFFSSGGQINAQIPFELAANSRVQVVEDYVCPIRPCDDSFALSDPITLAVARPGIFTVSQDGKGQGAILNNPQSAVVNSSAPATAGDVVSVFATGLGATQPAVRSGQPSPSQEPLARVTTPVTATVGGIPATVQFAGLAPTFVGLYQINVQIPAGVAPGPAVPIVLFQNGVPSNTVTLAVR